MRFAVATAASLVFPFAPAPGLRGLRAAHRRARVGGALARAPTRRCWSADTSSSSARSTARSATASQAPTGAPREELEQLALAARGVQAHLNGHQVVKVIVVPDKLVNFVVRA